MRFHFIITVNYPINAGIGAYTSNGCYVTKQGQTREDVFNAIFDMVCNNTGITNSNVMFFSLERDELSAA